MNEVNVIEMRIAKATFMCMHGLRKVVYGAVIVGLGLAGWWIYDYTRATGPIQPHGGLYFPVEVVHDVPQFFQADPRWASDFLGPTTGTLGAEGCAVASAAMVLARYGADLDPGRLNRFVQQIGGYTERGWLYWEAAAEYPPGVAELAYEDDPSHWLIDSNLLRGNPVIVRVRYASGITHFVVVVGKKGFDYLIRDPGRDGKRGIYPLADFETPVEALRFYRPMKQDG